MKLPCILSTVPFSSALFGGVGICVLRVKEIRFVVFLLMTRTCLSATLQAFVSALDPVAADVSVKRALGLRAPAQAQTCSALAHAWARTAGPALASLARTFEARLGLIAYHRL